MAKTNLKIWPKAILKKMEGKMESISGGKLWTIKKIWRKNVKVGIFSKYRDFPIPSLEVILPSNEVGVAGVPTCEFL